MHDFNDAARARQYAATVSESGIDAGDEADAGRMRVVVYGCRSYGNPDCHESATQTRIAQRLAALAGYTFDGEYDAHRHLAGDAAAAAPGASLYFVPRDTLVGLDLARSLGIVDARHLFGGVVPFPFVGRKTLSHGLAEHDSTAPPGWNADFARRVGDAVLPGWSAFTLNDARDAGLRLLAQGPVRVKLPGGIGGAGQFVVDTPEALSRCLQDIDPTQWLDAADTAAAKARPARRNDSADSAEGVPNAAAPGEGVVLELNLRNVATLSVGQVSVGRFVASYCGTQRLVRNNHGKEVYGGSTLTVARGGFDALLALPIDDHARLAVQQAGVYHDAASSCFAGMFASRSNYDVAQGEDADGQWRSGVLEQSWRAGGATPAEIAALELFARDPQACFAVASSCEHYGADAQVPDDAVIYFQGNDPRVGPLVKYARLESHGNT